MNELEREAGPLAGLAQHYLADLLQLKRHDATRLILDAVDAGISIRDIYLEVFQSVQHELGRLWQTNHISVAEEHYCTACTQSIMAQLYPRIFQSEKNGHRMVMTCVGGELHEIGSRMVADFFEMAGWDTYYLGANTPAKSILQTLSKHEVDVLGISVTIHFNLDSLTRLMTDLRNSADATTVKFLVGGRPFNLAPKLWQRIGADGSASNALQAVDVAARLIQS